MQPSQINKPTWFLLGIVLGTLFSLAYCTLMVEPSGAHQAPAMCDTAREEQRYCPSCPVCPDGSRPGLMMSNAAPPTPSPRHCPACPPVTCLECSSPPMCSPCVPRKEPCDCQTLRLGVQRVVSPIVETPDGTHVGIVQPLYELRGGRMVLPPGIRRLALDVGTSLLSPSSGVWFRRFPHDLLVLAFEPNAFSHSLVAYTSHPSMALNPKRFVFFSLECKMFQGQRIGPTLVQWYTNCMNVTFGHLIKHRDHFLSANAAVSNVNGFASFNLGVGDPGVGSLYEFKPGTEWTRPEKQHEAWGHAYVPKVRLDSILQHIPDDVTFELLKIDAQGHDAEVVAGVGHYLPRFKCVIGEFDTTAYAGAQEKEFDYTRLFRDAGFRTAGDGVWVNKRFLGDFQTRDYLCTAYDVKPTHASILRAASEP
eukprot:GGOE01001010.1.p1 GENE.GGOE01001010.1~~GGOE01001010.1.p1  ORF type:complete len:422 (-),score=100.79 GGOE01001010.1:75-1340(-)